MSDRELRGAERGGALGELEVEVQLLQARLRAGELSAARIELAAALGHQAAAVVSGHDCAESMSPCLRCWSGFQPLERASELGGAEAGLRIAIAGARCCFSALEQVAELEDWGAISAFICSRPDGLLLPGSWEEGSFEELSGWIAEVIELAEGHVLGEPAPREVQARVRLEALYDLERPFSFQWALLPLSLIDDPEHAPSWTCLLVVEEESLLQEIAREVIPWALGLADPLSARAGEGA